MPISRSFMNKDGEEILMTLEDQGGQVCEVWSRVMGYYRPVQEWNVGKRSEYADRQYMKMPEDVAIANVPQLRLPMG